MIRMFRHFGITVGNLERALGFYCEGLEFKLERQFQRPRDYTEMVTGVSGTALNAALISREGIVIELLEYQDRHDRPEKAPPVHHPGVAHICVQVDSIEQEMDRLISLGACFQDEVITVPPGPGQGNRVIYGWDPGGIAFELVELAQEVKS